MATRRRLLSAALYGLALALAPPPGAAQTVPEAALVPVQRFQAELIDIMRNADALGFDGRRQRFSALVEATFDVEFLQRYMFGRHAEGMSADQRETLGPLMFDFATSLLAQNFDGYSGQRFEPDFARQLRAGRVRVRSAFVEADGDVVQTDFLVAARGGADGWRVVDYLTAGVSGMQIQRGEFDSIMARGGPAALIERLRQKIAEMEARGRQ